MDKLDFILYLVIAFLIGFCVCLVIISYPTCEVCPEKKIDGFHIRDINTTQLNDIKQDKDYTGDWVCVNIRGMTFNRGLEVCRHEVFHEIWAECGESNELEFCIDKYKEEYTNEVKL